MSIEQKHQLVDDDAIFQYQELEGLNKKNIQALQKSYHVLSVIGSQSSGKSTLLNSLFNTTFEELNRKARVGQTTRGIWYAVDSLSSMMIVDVEGSDSFEREERTKVQRRNSLFALAVSHTLLINLWIQQIGLYKGSQLSILQIILQLNLRLFGSQQPKNILFIIRDFVKGQQNIETLKQKLFGKINQAWTNIKKPPGKQNIKLEELFRLQAYFLPSKLDQYEQYQKQIEVLRNHLISIAKNQKIINKNVSMADFPQYMKNLWETITNDKDVNLPQQKILLSNMKCHEIKKQIYEQFQNQFRDQLEKSERKLNMDFANNIKDIVQKMMDKYDVQTVQYHEQQAKKVKEEFNIELERKIQLSFSYQVKHIVSEVLRQFTDQVNKSFLKDKGIENIKTIKPQKQQRFREYLDRVSYRKEWIDIQQKKFQQILDQTFETQKERIVIDSLKDFDRSIKKQIENIVSNSFYDKKIFCQCFWSHLNTSLHELEMKIKNSIVNLYQKLQLKPKNNNNKNQKNNFFGKSINQHIQRAKLNANQQLKIIIKMKCNDLLYYMMRHFSVQFNIDEKGVPRQWPDITKQEILQLFEKTKQKYLDMIPIFAEYDLDSQRSDSKSPQKVPIRSTLQLRYQNEEREIMSSGQIMILNKKLKELMTNQYNQALKKKNLLYMGAIPKWGWLLLLAVSFDDIVSWLSSPILAVPLVLVLVSLGVFLYNRPGVAGSVMENVGNAARSSLSTLAVKATTGLIANRGSAP